MEEQMEEFRPWGSYTVLSDQVGYKVKQLTVSPESRLSLQSHQKRTEFWTVVEGQALVTLNDKDLILECGETLEIPLGARHRIANEEKERLVLIEVQLGTYLGEDDIERFEDDYGRS
jgi:mannose-6-phosphate isomerase-like protein (cupin superfamily)